MLVHGYLDQNDEEQSLGTAATTLCTIASKWMPKLRLSWKSPDAQLVQNLPFREGLLERVAQSGGVCCPWRAADTALVQACRVPMDAVHCAEAAASCHQAGCDVLLTKSHRAVQRQFRRQAHSCIEQSSAGLWLCQQDFHTPRQQQDLD